MTTLTEFLQARLDEDELLAQAAAAFITGSHWRSHKDVVETAEDVDADYLARSVAVSGNWTVPEHIARHDPARVLAEVEGKRRIIADLLAEPHFLNNSEWYGCRAVAEGPGEDDVPTGRECTCGRDARLDQYLRLFALPFADHPDYDPGWKP